MTCEIWSVSDQGPLAIRNAIVRLVSASVSVSDQGPLAPDNAIPALAKLEQERGPPWPATLTHAQTQTPPAPQAPQPPLEVLILRHPPLPVVVAG